MTAANADQSDRTPADGGGSVGGSAKGSNNSERAELEASAQVRLTTAQARVASALAEADAAAKARTALVIELAQDGHTLKWCADVLGIAYNNLTLQVRRMRATPGPTPGLTATEKAVERYKAGVTSRATLLEDLPWENPVEDLREAVGKLRDDNSFPSPTACHACLGAGDDPWCRSCGTPVSTA